MSRKDYELIAGCVARSLMAKGLERNAKVREAAEDGVRLVAIDLSASLAHTNPLFDKARFLKACGL